MWVWGSKLRASCLCDKYLTEPPQHQLSQFSHPASNKSPILFLRREPLENSEKRESGPEGNPVSFLFPHLPLPSSPKPHTSVSIPSVLPFRPPAVPPCNQGPHLTVGTPSHLPALLSHCLTSALHVPFSLGQCMDAKENPKVSNSDSGLKGMKGC